MLDAVVVICTRLQSKRLPHKATHFIHGSSALGHILRRIDGCGFPVIVATPQEELSFFKIFLKGCSVNDFYGGWSNSPLHRTVDAIRSTNRKPKWVVRITHDDVLIDKQTMIDLVKKCEDEDADYGYTPQIVEGAGVEVIKYEYLKKIAEEIKYPTEFISYYVKSGKVVTLEPRSGICRPYRLTLDYPEDLLVLETIFRNVGNDASLDKICEYLDFNNNILWVNRLPEVSFYTCVRNSEEFIAKTMLSILEANFTFDYEYIIVEDCSTDSTLNRIMSLYYSKNMKLIINERNLGLASSSNIALSEAKGRTVMRLDGDDYLDHQTSRNNLFTMISMIHTEYDVVYPQYNKFYQDDIGKIEYNCDPRENHHAGGALFEKKFINEIRFRDGLTHWDSLEIYNRIKDRAKIGYCDKSVFYYRVRENSLSHSKKNQEIRNQELEKLKQ